MMKKIKVIYNLCPYCSHNDFCKKAECELTPLHRLDLWFWINFKNLPKNLIGEKNDNLS